MRRILCLLLIGGMTLVAAPEGHGLSLIFFDEDGNRVSGPPQDREELRNRIKLTSRLGSLWWTDKEWDDLHVEPAPGGGGRVVFVDAMTEKGDSTARVEKIVAKGVTGTVITIINADGTNEGFNDPTAVTPVGGNDGTTLGQQRLNVFSFAANIWANLLVSSVPIRVVANFDPQFCAPNFGVLGSAGPIVAVNDFPGAPRANTLYPSALANALAGSDLSPTSDDIIATFNSDIDNNDNCLSGVNWYYGFDGLPPGQDVDLVSTLLHELAHGLGFLTFVGQDGRRFTDSFGNPLDDIYMVNLRDATTGRNWTDMSDAERSNSATNTGNLVWTGFNVTNGGSVLTQGVNSTGFVEMYAPNPYEGGSSVSHYSTRLFPNELMDPFETGPTQDTALTLDLFQDIGWPTTETDPNAPTPTETDVGGGPVITPTSVPPRPGQPTFTRTSTQTLTPTFTISNTPTITPTVTPSLTPTVTSTPRIDRAVTTESAGNAPVFSTAGELDGTKFDDIASVSYSGNEVSVLINGGTAGKNAVFSGVSATLDTGQDSNPSFVGIGQLNGIGGNDLLVVAPGRNQLLGFLNQGGGTFDSSPQILDVDMGEPLSFFMGDLDMDNDQDLAIANTDSDDITVVLNPGTGQGLLDPSAESERFSVSPGQLPAYIQGGLLDQGSLSIDLVTPNFESGNISVLLGNGNGTFRTANVYSTGVNPRNVAIAELNGDGHNDVAVACEGSDTDPGGVWLFINDGNGIFGAGRELLTGNHPVAVGAFDYDGGDGTDLAVLHQGTNGGQGDLRVFYNDGSGNFVDSDPLSGVGNDPFHLALGGINGPTRDDLIVSNRGSSTVSIFQNEIEKRGATFADLDRNGITDGTDLFLMSLVPSYKDERIRGIADLDRDSAITVQDLVRFLEVKDAEIPIPPMSSPAKSRVDRTPEELRAAADKNGDGTVDRWDVLTGF